MITTDGVNNAGHTRLICETCDHHTVCKYADQYKMLFTKLNEEFPPNNENKFKACLDCTEYKSVTMVRTDVVGYSTGFLNKK